MYNDYTEAERAWIELHLGHPLESQRTFHVGSGRLISVHMAPLMASGCTHYLKDLCCLEDDEDE